MRAAYCEPVGTNNPVFLPLGLFLLLSGSIPFSLNPYYTPEDLVFNPMLTGLWKAGNADDTWEFLGRNPTSYTMISRCSHGGREEFTVHLFRIGDSTFMDYFPDESAGSNGVSLPAHSLVIVGHVGAFLSLSCLPMERVRKYLKAYPRAIGHERIGRSGSKILFTAPPEELRGFLVKLMRTGGLPARTVVLRRVSGNSFMHREFPGTAPCERGCRIPVSVSRTGVPARRHIR